MWTVNTTWPIALQVAGAVLRAAESWSILSVPLLANAADSCRGELKRRTMRIGFVEVAFGMGAISGIIIASVCYGTHHPFWTFPVRVLAGVAIAPLSLLLVGNSEHQAALKESNDDPADSASLSPLGALRTLVRRREGHAR